MNAVNSFDTNDAIQTGYYSIGLTSKDVSRLWLQGSCLSVSGFTKGQEYHSDYDKTSRVITLTIADVNSTNPSGTRSVSGRKNNTLNKTTPIVELANSKLLSVTRGAEQVRVDFYVGVVVISIHHLEEKKEEREERFIRNMSNGYLTRGCVSPCIDTPALFQIETTRHYLNADESINLPSYKKVELIEASLTELESGIIDVVDELAINLPPSTSNAKKFENSSNYAKYDPIAATGLFGAVDIIRESNPSVIFSESFIHDVSKINNLASYHLLKALIGNLGYEVTDSNPEIDLDAVTEAHYWFVATSSNLSKKIGNSYSPSFIFNSKNFFKISDVSMKPINNSNQLLVQKQIEREESLKSNLRSGTITKGVLCAGIGISTAASTDGMMACGVRTNTSYIIDRELKYLEVAFENNHAVSEQTKIIKASLEEVEGNVLSTTNEISVSLPCTGQSPSGKSKLKIKLAELHPTDATALFGAMNVIRSGNAAAIFSENVVPAKNSVTYQIFISMLILMKYTITEVTLNRKDTNSFENRDRYWFVATSNGLPKADIAAFFPSFKKNVHKLKDIMEDIPAESKMWKSTAEKIRKAAVNKANGKNFGFNLVDANVTSIGVCGKGYQKDRASEAHIAGTEGFMRLLTTKELALSQSVPLHLISNQTAQVLYQGLGQGIDYRQGAGVSIAVAKGVYRKIISDEREELNLAS